MFRTRTLFAAGFAALSVLLSGCDIFGGGHTGTYVLKTVNGKPLPAVILEIIGTYKAEITAGSVTLNEDNTFSASITFRETEGSTVRTQTETDSGTYTISGNTITFTSPGTGPAFTGTLSGGTLTVTTEEDDITLVLVFEK
ncbi:hypothetical protein HRbin33_02187 [bacterium HR33]|nr:hypothetical protein HRbin33_02187 [bacterium HR33]